MFWRASAPGETGNNSVGPCKEQSNLRGGFIALSFLLHPLIDARFALKLNGVNSTLRHFELRMGIAWTHARAMMCADQSRT